MKLIWLLLLIFSAPSYACLCSDAEALEKGVAAIAEKFSGESPNIESYVLSNNKRKYFIVPKGIDPNVLGGGHPQAVINMENCDVISVGRAQ